MDWWLVVVLLGELAFLGWIIHIVVSYRLKKAAQRAEERYRVLQRFESTEQLNDFLAGESGQKLLVSTADKTTGSWKLMFMPIFLGFFCLFVGIGLLISGAIVTAKDAESFWVGGTLVVLGGIGLLTATALSLRLAKRWGLHPSQIDRLPAE